MKSLVSVIAVALISTTAVNAQSVVGQPVEAARAQTNVIFADAREPGRNPGARLTVTQGEISTDTAGNLFPAQDRALLGLGVNDPVTVTRFSSTPDTGQAYIAR